jgi:hypothetical protein
MIGMLLIAVVLLWIAASAWLAQRFGSLFPEKRWRKGLKVILFAVFLVVPLIDEIVGGSQFRSLCRENAVLKIDRVRIKGKTIRVVIDPSNGDVEDTTIRIFHSRFSYRDVKTNEELATYSRYVAEGGWLVRTLGMDSHMPPLVPVTLHDSSTCGPPDRGDFSATYGFIYQIEKAESTK